MATQCLGQRRALRADMVKQVLVIIDDFDTRSPHHVNQLTLLANLGYCCDRIYGC